MNIGIDLDLTVIQSDKGWYEWLQCMCGGENEFKPWSLFKEQVIRQDGEINYDLSVYFPPPKNEDTDPHDFWRSTSCYDMLKPVQGAVETIKSLQGKGHHITFISALKGHSHRSKYQWVERHFENFAFVPTQEKEMVKVDVMIDDRINVLNRLDFYVDRILFATPYEQVEPIVKGKYYNCEDWVDVEKSIDKILEQSLVF